MQRTSVRILVAGLLTLMACLLYLDRYAVGIASKSMKVDLNMTETQMSWFLSAFFWSYALCQVPAGWLSDRFGPRIMLTVYILAWSLFTGLLGVTTQVSMVLLLRFLCGAAQAGAYPVCSGMVRKWFPLSQRGSASSVVAMGGRSGAVLAPILTAALITAFAVPSASGALVGGWQQALIVYGFAGIIVAFVFAWICRDSPVLHPWCNEAEQNFITSSTAASLTPTIESAAVPAESVQSTVAENDRFPLVAVVTSLSLWANSLTQFLTNIGWLFVVTWLPRYLGDVHSVPLNEQAVMTAVPTLAGIIGMLSGGWWTDFAAHRFGLKWGRRLPMMATRFTAAAGYGICLFLGMTYMPDAESRWLPWMMIGGLSVATFSCDLGVPAMWAYSNDVGGKYTASVMGWANMHGNFGAAVAPPLYNAILGETPTLSQWNSLFAFCMCVFALAGVAASVIDATKPIGISEKKLSIA